MVVAQRSICYLKEIIGKDIFDLHITDIFLFLQLIIFEMVLTSWLEPLVVSKTICRVAD